MLNSVQFFVSLLTIATQKMNVWEWTAHPNLYVITPRLSGNCRLFFCTHTHIYIYILSMDITCYVGSLIKEMIKYYQFLYCSKWLLTYYKLYTYDLGNTLFFAWSGVQDSTIRLLAVGIFDLGQIEKSVTIFFRQMS